MDKLTTLLLQARLGWKDPASNRAHLQSLLEGCAEPFDIAVFPETFTTGFLGDSEQSEEGMDGPTLAWMHTLCREHDCALAGSLVISENGQRFNRLVFVTADGLKGWYDKRHLFSYGGEDRRYTAGCERVIVEHLGWRINLQICYDLRFPAWCRNRDDYDLMLLVANWPSGRVHHWSALLQARAIENQSWVIGVNRVGEDGNGFRYPGRSVVHDALGATVAQLGGEERVERVVLSLEGLRAVRRKFPFQADADGFRLDV